MKSNDQINKKITSEIILYRHKIIFYLLAIIRCLQCWQ